MDAIFIFGAKYLYLLAVLIVLVYFFRSSRATKKDLVVFAVIALPVAYILALIAGHIYFDLRPFVADGFAPLIPHAADNGFPSDHTLLVSALAMVMYAFNKKASVAVWVIAVLVGISRVYVGVHHPIDILGAIVIAILGGLAADYIVKRFLKKRSYKIRQ